MTDPDRKLARQAGRGDRRALAGLYERHRHRLMGYLLRMTADPQLGEDVFQEVWIKVMQGIGRYNPDRGTFRAWLFRIAGNAAVDRLRYEVRRRTDDLDAPSPASDTAPLPPPPSPRCLGCGAEVDPEFKVCPYCGISLRCRQCERTLQAGWKVYPYCGDAVEGESQA